MKLTFTMTEPELKGFIQRQFELIHGTRVVSVRFNVTDSRDAFDQKTGGHIVDCEVQMEEAEKGQGGT